MAHVGALGGVALHHKVVWDVDHPPLAIVSTGLAAGVGAGRAGDGGGRGADVAPPGDPARALAAAGHAADPAGADWRAAAVAAELPRLARVIGAARVYARLHVGGVGDLRAMR